MNIGTLTIEMAANVARLQRDMDQAKAMVGGAMADIQRSVGYAKSALGALGAGLSLGALASFVKGAIDAADQINKLSQRTGIAAENLSQLQYAAKLADVSTDSLTTGIKKLNVSIAEGLAGDKAKIAMFKELGITQQDLGKGTEAVMLQMANAFAGARDGAGKTAISVALLGKAGDEMIPFLNGGARAILDLKKEAADLGLTISGEFSRQAEEFNDNITRTKSALNGLAISLGGEVVESWSKVIKAMADAARTGGALDVVIAGIQTRLFGDKEHQENVRFAELTNNALKFERALADARKSGMDQRGIDARQKALDDIKKEIAAIKMLRDVRNGVNESAAETARLRRDPKNVGYTTLSVPGRAGGGGGGGDQDAARAAADLKRELEAQAKVLAELNGFTATYNEEAERLQRMYAASAISAEQYNQALDNLLAAQPGAIAATRARIEAASLANKLAEDAIDADERQRVAVEAQIKGARTMLENLQFETELLTMSNEQRAIAIAQRELEAQGIVKGTVAYEAYIAKIREAVTRKEDVTKQVQEIERQNESWKSMWESVDSTAHDVFVNIFEGGQSAFKKIGNVIKSSVLDLLYQITVKRWVLQVGASVTGGLGMTGAANAANGLLSSSAGGGGLLSSLGSAGGMLSGLSSIGAMGGNFMAGLNTGLVSAWGAGGSIMGGLELGAGLMGSGATAGGLGTMVGVLGPIAAALGALVLIAGQFKGETRSGAQYDYGVTGMGNFGTAGAVYRSGPSGGQIAGDQVIGSINATVQGINATLAALGSNAKLIGFQAGLETSGKGRGGVYAGGTLSTGAMFGDLGAGGGRSNYAGTLYDPSKGFSLDGEGALKAFALDLKQATIQALQAAADIPNTIRKQLEGVDASKLTEDAATALLTSINSQVTAVAQFKAAMDLLPFAELRDLSFDAASALAEAAGGLDQLAQQAATYYDNFFSAEEKRANTIRLIKRELDGAGFELSEGAIGRLTRGDFRLLVEQFADLGDLGEPAYLALLKVSGAFASITEGADSAAQGLRDSIDAFRDVRRSLAEFQRGLAQEFGQLSPEAAYLRARRDFRGAASGAAAGNLADMQRLEGAASAFLGASQGYNASGSQYFADFAAVEAALTAARNSAAAQVDVAQLQLSALDAINNSVLSLPEALAEQVERQMRNSQMLALFNQWSEANAETQQAQRDWRAGDLSDSALHAIVDISTALKRQFEALFGISVSDYGATQNHAAGGTFTNGVFSAPTRFAAHQMGEAGPEAVMPLTSINGSLGVRAVGDSRAMVDKLGRLEALAQRQADLIEVLINQQGATGTRLVANTQRSADALERGSRRAAMEAARK